MFAPFRAVPRELTLFERRQGHLSLVAPHTLLGFIDDGHGPRPLGAGHDDHLTLEPGSRGRISIGDAMIDFDVRAGSPRRVGGLVLLLVLLGALVQVGALGAWWLSTDRQAHAATEVIEATPPVPGAELHPAPGPRSAHPAGDAVRPVERGGGQRTGSQAHDS